MKNKKKKDAGPAKLYQCKINDWMSAAQKRFDDAIRPAAMRLQAAQAEYGEIYKRAEKQRNADYVEIDAVIAAALVVAWASRVNQSNSQSVKQTNRR